MKAKEYILAIIAGMAMGILLVHSLTMIIREFFHWHEGYWHLHWYEIPDAINQAYSLAHLPNAITYGILTSIVFYLWRKSNTTYRRIAGQSLKFALIGREASTIIHDINNPVFGIQMFVDILREELNDTEKRDICQKIKSSAERISGLVAEIKTLASSDGQMIINKMPNRMDQLTTKVSEDLRLHAKLEIDRSLAKEVPVDPLYFERVLLNIIKNADDALRGRHGGVIRLSLHSEKNRALIWIADNGPGIQPSIRKCLFEFGVTHGKKHGTGLGLYAAHRITEAHGGTLMLKDSSNRGTIFEISLPLT
ncbi:MAG: hypothetical protein GF401_16260 [Chitinivibrionales bacterium]|nr:hypothetical protein [Chitinivibrionales bacterium]